MLLLLFVNHSADRGPFYKKQLIIEEPSSACEVKVKQNILVYAVCYTVVFV